MNAEEAEVVRAMADRMEALERDLSAARNREHLDDIGFIALARRTVGDLVTMEQLRDRLLNAGFATAEQLGGAAEEDLAATLDLVNYFVAGGR